MNYGARILRERFEAEQSHVYFTTNILQYSMFLLSIVLYNFIVKLRLAS